MMKNTRGSAAPIVRRRLRRLHREQYRSGAQCARCGWVDLLLTDLRLGGEDGMALIEKVLQRARPPICILMTAYGSIATAVEAMRKGAYDFVTKPINLDELGMKIRRAIDGQRLEQENLQLKQQVQQRFGLENLIGESPAIHPFLIRSGR